MTIVITGASGVVGGAILRELERRGRAADVVALTYTGQVTTPNVRTLQCDLSHPRLRLTDTQYRELVRETTAIVHSGALTEWGRPAEQYDEINVLGTQHVIELAKDAQAPILHMSTAYVAAIADTAAAKLSDTNVVGNYIRSKRECEWLLRESGVPHSVYRPTNLIGDADTGMAVRGQIVQTISGWLWRGRAPFYPAHPGNLVDIVPQDLLAKAVVTAIENQDVSGEYWVTYGAKAMTVAHVLDICAGHARAAGRSAQPPPIVHPDDIDMDMLDGMSPLTRSYVRVLMDVSEVTACCGGVLPTSMPELCRRFGVPVVSDEDAYLRNLDHWSTGGW